MNLPQDEISLRVAIMKELTCSGVNPYSFVYTLYIGDSILHTRVLVSSFCGKCIVPSRRKVDPWQSNRYGSSYPLKEGEQETMQLDCSLCPYVQSHNGLLKPMLVDARETIHEVRLDVDEAGLLWLAWWLGTEIEDTPMGVQIKSVPDKDQSKHYSECEYWPEPSLDDWVSKDFDPMLYLLALELVSKRIYRRAEPCDMRQPLK
jgi:hypothetical protein